MSIIFTFCVSGSNYVSASSQDGRSPVWARPLAHVPEGMGEDIRVTSAFLMHDFVSCLPDIRPWPKYRPCRRLWAISLLYPTPKSAHESQIHHRPLPQKFERGCRRCWYTCQGLRHTISQFCFSYILGPVLVWCPRWTYFFCRVQWPACLSLGWREGSPTVTVWARSQSMRGDSSNGSFAYKSRSSNFWISEEHVRLAVIYLPEVCHLMRSITAKESKDWLRESFQRSGIIFQARRCPSDSYTPGQTGDRPDSSIKSKFSPFILWQVGSLTLGLSQKRMKYWYFDIGYKDGSKRFLQNLHWLQAWHHIWRGQFHDEDGWQGWTCFNGDVSDMVRE